MCQKTPIIVSRRSTLETVGRKVLAGPVCMGCLCRYAVWFYLNMAQGIKSNIPTLILAPHSTLFQMFFTDAAL